MPSLAHILKPLRTFWLSPYQPAPRQLTPMQNAELELSLEFWINRVGGVVTVVTPLKNRAGTTTVALVTIEKARVYQSAVPTWHADFSGALVGLMLTDVGVTDSGVKLFFDDGQTLTLELFKERPLWTTPPLQTK